MGLQPHSPTLSAAYASEGIRPSEVGTRHSLTSLGTEGLATGFCFILNQAILLFISPNVPLIRVAPAWNPHLVSLTSGIVSPLLLSICTWIKSSDFQFWIVKSHNYHLEANNICDQICEKGSSTHIQFSDFERP